MWEGKLHVYLNMGGAVALVHVYLNIQDLKHSFSMSTTCNTYVRVYAVSSLEFTTSIVQALVDSCYFGSFHK